MANTNHRKYNQIAKLDDSGFSLWEMIVVVMIIGILSAIAIPNWLSFINNRRLTVANNQVYLVIRQAQNLARKEKTPFHASFREENNILQWSVHPATTDPINATWHNLDKNVALDAETTLPLSNGVMKVEFDHLGSVKPPLRRITLSNKLGGKSKRCVFVSTILGALRTAKERNQPNDGKYCY